MLVMVTVVKYGLKSNVSVVDCGQWSNVGCSRISTEVECGLWWTVFGSNAAMVECGLWSNEDCGSLWIGAECGL